MERTVFYKIRDKATGLYSMGGADVANPVFGRRYWNKTGKTFNERRYAVASINMALQYVKAQGWPMPTTWEIVEFHTVEVMTSQRDIFK